MSEERPPIPKIVKKAMAAIPDPLELFDYKEPPAPRRHLTSRLKGKKKRGWKRWGMNTERRRIRQENQRIPLGVFHSVCGLMVAIAALAMGVKLLRGKPLQLENDGKSE